MLFFKLAFYVLSNRLGGLRRPLQCSFLWLIMPLVNIRLWV